jgi:hypothetical protein
MKKFYAILVITFALLSARSEATTITLTVNGGDWNSNSSWDLNRTPQTGDTIIVPVAYTVNIYTNVSIAGYVYVQDYGTIAFNHSSKLDLGSTSKIFIHAGGKMTSVGTSASDQARVGGTIDYKGNSGDLNGPVLLDVSGVHPVSEIALPVKFVSFTVARKNDNVLVEWSTAQEFNSSNFIVERSENGSTWSVVASVKAAGESSALINYSYTDKSTNAAITYYRIKQVDLDGAYIYTAVRSIKAGEGTTEVSIATASSNTVLVNFSREVKSTVIIRLVSMSGQVIAQKSVSNPAGQVVFSTANTTTGVYVVNVTDGKDVKTSKQVLL